MTTPGPGAGKNVAPEVEPARKPTSGTARLKAACFGLGDTLASDAEPVNTPAYRESHRCQSISSPSTMAHRTPTDPGTATKATCIGLLRSGRNRSAHPSANASAVAIPPIRDAHSNNRSCNGLEDAETLERTSMLKKINKMARNEIRLTMSDDGIGRIPQP